MVLWPWQSIFLNILLQYYSTLFFVHIIIIGNYIQSHVRIILHSDHIWGKLTLFSRFFDFNPVNDFLIGLPNLCFWSPLTSFCLLFNSLFDFFSISFNISIYCESSTITFFSRLSSVVSICLILLSNLAISCFLNSSCFIINWIALFDFVFSASSPYF